MVASAQRLALIAAMFALAACKPPNVLKVEKTGDGGVGAVCGNGVVEVGEVCDPPGPSCSADCKSDLSCGNLIVDPGEVCDDGNHKDCDGCSHDCKSDETCGNRYVDACRGEQCDDGVNVTTGACPKCRNARCGDGFVWAGREQCDDGTNATDGA